MGIDFYNFPGGFLKPAALKALRNVINTQIDGSHVKMIIDVQATEKNNLGFCDYLGTERQILYRFTRTGY